MNYDNLINNLNNKKVEELLYHLGAIEVIRKDECLITNTICHNAQGGSLKLYYYFDTHLFYCYTECGGMSIFSFLKHYYDSRNFEYDWYNDIYELVLKCTNNDSFEDSFNFDGAYESLKDKYRRKKKKTLNIYSENVLDLFEKYYPVEWLNEGITEKAMDKFNILFSKKDNKIIIPHYDVKNRLVGIRGRALDQWEVENIGKYTPIKIENTFYSHPLSMNLYGLNLTKSNIKRTGICYVFEGEKSVLHLESSNMVNMSVAVCGSIFSIFQLKLLLKYKPKEIVICFDKEEKAGEDKYYNKLLNMCKKYTNYCNFSFIYDFNNLLDLKDSPIDKGEEIFKELLRKRIKVNES